MSDSAQNRVLHYAVLASLALHALLLFGFSDLIDTARRAVSVPPAIIARLMAPEPAPEPPAAPAQPAQETKAAAKPRIEKPAAVPVPREAAPQTPAPQPPSIAPTPAVPAPPVTEAPAVASIQPTPAPGAPSPAVAPEALSRDQYRLQLIDEARRHKRYPPLARENNWQGEVPVRVLVGANGRASVTLRGSSGYEVLDRQALEMFGLAARAVPVPQALRGKEFVLEMRAVYGLED